MQSNLKQIPIRTSTLLSHHVEDPTEQCPRKSVRLVRIFLDKSKFCGHFWSEQCVRQIVSGHFISCPCPWTSVYTVDKYP